jgi:hypothetical protein
MRFLVQLTNIMKKLIVFLLLCLAGSLQAATSINITANGTYPNPGPDGVNAYWSLNEGEKYSFSIKGSFVTASIDIQEAFINEAGVEEWGSIGGKSAVMATEDFSFVAIGNKVRFVVTLETTDDINVIGPTPIRE